VQTSQILIIHQQTPTNVEDFVKIAQRIRSCGVLMFQNWVNFSSFWVPQTLVQRINPVGQKP